MVFSCDFDFDIHRKPRHRATVVCVCMATPCMLVSHDQSVAHDRVIDKQTIHVSSFPKGPFSRLLSSMRSFIRLIFS